MVNPSPEHQKLVQAAIRTFQEQGYVILSADYGNFARPGKHGRREPDIVMKAPNEILHLVEAKLGNDLSSITTKEQLIDFSNRIMLSTSSHPRAPIPFHIVVYREDVAKLILLLRSLGLNHLVSKRIFIHWLVET